MLIIMQHYVGVSFKFLFLSAIVYFIFFFFNDTATTEIYTLSLHDALPISSLRSPTVSAKSSQTIVCEWSLGSTSDRKSTRLNSSHRCISYAVFCLKKKKKKKK